MAKRMDGLMRGLILLAVLGIFAAAVMTRTPAFGTISLAQAAPAPTEQCDADASWFAVGGPSKPIDSEPTRGDDCAFYQRAMQQFLFAVAGTQTAPAFLQYKGYGDEFGADRIAGLLSGAPSPTTNRNLMVLAPRLQKAADETDAQDVFQAGSNALLIDQAGHPIFYNIFMNPAFSNLIEAKHYNDVATLKAIDPEVELPPGVVEFKAAWQIVDAKHPPTDRIVVQARVPWLVVDPATKRIKVDASRGLRPVTVALIGLHVVFTTENHPEMIWATFEYTRNAPAAAGNPVFNHTSPGACANDAEPRSDTVATDGQPYLLFTPGTAMADANRKPTAITAVDDANQTFSPAASIVRRFPFSSCYAGIDPAKAVGEVDPAVTALNLSYAAKNKSSWLAHYALVGAVWLDEPRSPHDDLAFHSGRLFDDFQLGGENRLSSQSMESFTQESAPNCFACHHTNAKGKLGPMRLSVSHMFRRFAFEKF